MPRVLCVPCGALAEYIIRKDYEIQRGGISVCGKCKPTSGVWVLELDQAGVEKVSGSVIVKAAGRTKGRLAKKS